MDAADRELRKFILLWNARPLLQENRTFRGQQPLRKHPSIRSPPFALSIIIFSCPFARDARPRGGSSRCEAGSSGGFGCRDVDFSEERTKSGLTPGRLRRKQYRRVGWRRERSDGIHCIAVRTTRGCSVVRLINRGVFGQTPFPWSYCICIQREGKRSDGPADGVRLHGGRHGEPQ